MNIKFTKRSSKDKTLVTVAMSQFKGTSDPVQQPIVGNEMVLVIEGVPTVFKLTRPGKDGYATAATSHGFPRFLRLPSVGRPTRAKVTRIYYV